MPPRKIPLQFFALRQKPHRFLVYRAARPDRDDLDFFSGRHAVNNPESAYPQTSISFQIILKPFAASGLCSNFVQRGMDPFFQQGMERADEGGQLVNDSDGREGSHGKGAIIRSGR
jgi:hypothetical protein